MTVFPRDWKEPTLDEVCAFNPKHPRETTREISVSFVPMPAVDEVRGEIVAPTVRQLSEVWKGFTHFADGDVLFAKITPCMENGKSAIAKNLENGLGCGSTEFHVLRPGAKLNASYLWRFLRQKTFREEAEAAMTGAVGQRRVPINYLRETRIPLPPLPEQRRIVSKLDSLTGSTSRARDELERIPTLVKKYREAILSRAFSGELTADWRAARRRPQATEAAVRSIVSDIRYGTARKCGVDTAGTAVLRIPNVSAGKIDLADLKYACFELKELTKLRLEEGDILVVRSNGSPDLVGRPAVVSGNAVGMAYAGYLIRLRPNKALVDPWYLVEMLQAPETRVIIETGARSTSGVHNVNANELAALKVPLPDLDEQKEVVRCMAKAFSWLDRIVAEHANASRLLPRLNQAILSKAFRGDLLPDPEHAAAE
ncbi:hypothetical+protein [Methylocapsa aurea]|uniref:restriction endonuclease subunit S n=1 Tax=Methylocapsa aurea TaxID=663610 RepID=UPI003D18E374